MKRMTGIISVRDALADSRSAGREVEKHIQRNRIYVHAEESWDELPLNTD